LPTLIEQWIGTLVRAGLSGLGGYLVSQGLIDGNMSLQLIALAPMLASLAWSAWAKYRNRLFTEVAKELPAGASDASVTQEINLSTPTENMARAMRKGSSIGG
jgi:predicted lipid-binding transport protein (Tim44 family)